MVAEPNDRDPQDVPGPAQSVEPDRAPLPALPLPQPVAAGRAPAPIIAAPQAETAGVTDGWRAGGADAGADDGLAPAPPAPIPFPTGWTFKVFTIGGEMYESRVVNYREHGVEVTLNSRTKVFIPYFGMDRIEMVR